MKVLLLNQCFYPDVMATAQQLTSLALGLSERGHAVTVVTSDRGYDDPGKRFPRRESWRGIDIIRLPTLALGKSSKWRRSLNFVSFLFACSLRLLLLSRFDCVVALTSPPLISFLGALFVKLKGGKFFFWTMDLNPDEAIAAGWLKRDSATARLLESLLRYSLRHAQRVIVLDRFMRRRLELKGISADRIEIVSPWALDSGDDAVAYDEQGRGSFRAQHGLAESFVVMYAGNHSPCHPLDTLLEAAELLRDRTDVCFCFVGGGSEQVKVAAFSARKELKNIRCLPYQSHEYLSGSLSAADLQVVVMGDPFVGIVHPCKVYNILQVGSPLLYIGPEESSVADVAAQLDPRYPVYQARHGESERVAENILSAVAAKSSRDVRAGREVTGRFSEATLLPRMIEALESGTLIKLPEQAGQLVTSEK
jgi:glycosyltransferase involved in cell wall biosynthesis